MTTVIKGQSFYGEDFRKSNIYHYTYRRCEFHRCNFKGVLESVKFSACDFYSCDFSDAAIGGADFNNCVIHDTDFTDVVFKDVCFRKTTFDLDTVFTNTDLSDAKFRDECVFLFSDLNRAILNNAKLGECIGDGVYMKSVVLGTFICTYTHDHLSIGCQTHPIEKWSRWNTVEGRKWIRGMALEATEWAEEYLDLVLSVIDKSPAKNTRT